MTVHQEKPHEQVLRYRWKLSFINCMPAIETDSLPRIHVASVWHKEVANAIILRHNDALDRKLDLQDEIEDLTGESCEDMGIDPDEWEEEHE